MDKFFKILYYYFLGLFVFFVVYMISVLAVSPKKDVLKRGFIPCTEQFLIDISSCQRGNISCPLKWVWKDTMCNAYVIFDGLGAWIKGKQETPWSSYLFSPVVEAQMSEDIPYDGMPDEDMKELDKQRKFIELKHEELEQARNRNLTLDENVLIPSPDLEFEPKEFSDVDYENTVDDVKNIETKSELDITNKDNVVKDDKITNNEDEKDDK